jgi:hypothetical protein
LVKMLSLAIPAADEPSRRWKRTAPSARGVVGTAKVPRADQITGA